VLEFVFMLTHHDTTVANARQVYDEVRGTGLRYVGFKDIGATTAELAAVTRAAHDDGLQVMLEVVSTSEDDEIESISAGAGLGVDWVLGGTHPERGREILSGTGVKYCPFPGIVEDHPSVLKGEISEIADDARRLTATAGIDGVDLLAYRHVSADPLALIRAVVAAASGPVIVAGSVASLDQIRAVAATGAWGFTIGGAIFEGLLPGGPDVARQVDVVLAACSGQAADR
jgi:acyl CoA:acetate/3-ketoacid CoA transferase alpha subunit